MKKLIERAKNVIFRFDLQHVSGKWSKHPIHLDYESGKYRQDELIKLVRDTVIHFALTPDEFNELVGGGDVSDASRRAWARISKAKRDSKGDYGEVLLFLILKMFFPATERFVTKVRLRSSKRDQIKGFDCAHFTIEGGDVVLWLGEAKFHQSFSTAVTEAVKSLTEHFETQYLKDEISILHSNIEINKDCPDYAKLESVLNGSRSIDTIKFKIPVLLTYDSAEVVKHTSVTTPAFIQKMKDEFMEKFKKIDEQKLSVSANFDIVFLVFPFESVKVIKEELEKIENASR